MQSMKTLITGGGGLLAGDLIPLITRAGHSVAAYSRQELDIMDPVMVERRLIESEPGIVFNCAAYTSVDKAETEQKAAFAVNRDGAAHLADACGRNHIPLVHISTDYVFDGKQDRPYREEDQPHPLNMYGQSKWEGEEEVRKRCREHIIVRTSWLYGDHGNNFGTRLLAQSRERNTLEMVDNQVGCPTWTHDLASALLVILERVRSQSGDFPWGTYHFCGEGSVSRYDFARAIVAEASRYESFRLRSIIPVHAEKMHSPARRPVWSALDTARIESVFGVHPRSLKDSLTEMLAIYYSR